MILRELVGAGRGDREPRSITVSPPQLIGRGYRDYHRFVVTERPTTEAGTTFERDVLRSGRVVGVLALDPERDELVLTRQFRIGGHLATGRGEMIEIVAGRVDPGETPEAAARRECIEEIGLTPLSMTRLFDFLPAPALTDEVMTLFLARVDAAAAPMRAGASHEGEDIEVIRCPISRAIDLMKRNEIQSAPTIIVLQWLQLASFAP
ncbi:NUDIX hydrolase [Bradyrhizobium sp. WSM 1704]|uniref:NUDIX hydrolase n=1 Tax=Bradyrhizobium semiaridum TaxID=2821404 RepID=UPI0028A29AD2|nr:NUDIX hydrolase [Bradyrhizobium semiaridum]MCA6125192.1 NUDIX hydrolase [Bradyrhizobium semiaridum]